MNYQITLISRDGKQVTFPCTATQNVQDAAEAAGFFPPALCKAGSCGSCVATCSTGDYRLDTYTPSLLPKAARERGDILLCRTYPKSDLAITAPYPSDQIRSYENLPRQADIITVETIAERTMRLILQLLPDAQGSMAFDFEPGQFVELEIPSFDIKRAYSLANTPNWDGRLEFLIRLQPKGQFSTYLRWATPGQRLQVHGPAGAFLLNTQGLKPRCFVAGGTGLAPFLSMLWRMAEWGEDHPTTLFLGVNNEKEIFCQAELAELSSALPQLKVQICVWQASEGWKGFVGTPAQALRVHLETTAILPDVYLCGPPQLVEAAIEVAHDAGIRDKDIFVERFS